jgi:hypothetical protein
MSKLTNEVKIEILRRSMLGESSRQIRSLK